MRLTPHIRSYLAVLLLMLCAALAPATPVAAASGYEYYVTGNSGDVTTATTGGLMLMGGGSDVDAAFQWLLGKAGGGDIVVIRASGTDAYNPYIYDLGVVDSVATLIIKTRTAASSSFVVDTIRRAEAVFIAGGNQWDYVNLWKGTPVEDAIHFVSAKPAPIGGTSAGLAVMGEFAFSAQNGTITSPEALANPYDRKVALSRDFLVLPHLSRVITDSHFVSRDRMGRLATFLGRLVQDGWATEARGIGIDEQTALVVESNGAAALRGTGAAYFLRTPGAPEICQSRIALTYRNLAVYRVAGSATFNLTSWSGSGGTAYTISANQGSLSSSQAGGRIY